MLFTRGKDIVRASVNPAYSAHSEYPLPITPQDFVADASALDFDSRDGRIYWSDIQVSHAIVVTAYSQKKLPSANIVTIIALRGVLVLR